MDVRQTRARLYCAASGTSLKTTHQMLFYLVGNAWQVIGDTMDVSTLVVKSHIPVLPDKVVVDMRVGEEGIWRE